MIQIKNLSKTFHSGDKEVHALKDVNLTIEDGEIYGIIGYSGSGKSTLIRCINRLEEPDSGEVLVGDVDITKLSERELREKRKKIGIIFQHFNLLKNDTVYKNVARPLIYAGVDKKEIKNRVDKLLDIVGLSDKKKNYPSQLSGGQKQRVAIARALAEEPDILLCDEATSALDPDTTKQIIALLKKLNKELNLTMIVVTHQMEVIRDLCTKVAVLSKGEVVDEGKTLDVFAKSENPVTIQFANGLFQTEEIQEVIKHEKVQKLIEGGGRVYRLLFLGESTGDALISEVSRRFNVNSNIIFGNIVFFQDEPVGSLYVVIQGIDRDIDAAVKYIEGKKVLIHGIH
ncbi:MAG: ATP-binding cassette domain-containing protein [Eubacterium sp.]|nr:ATP-binding cassette domain-containing protein [Eubacterium sp.]